MKSRQLINSKWMLLGRVAFGTAVLACTIFNGNPCLAAPVENGFCLPDKHLAQYVVNHLDLASFPSSVSFRLASNKTTFADYDIVPEELTENSAVLESKNRDWKFEICIVKHDKASVTVCLHDFANNGSSSFNFESILLLKPTSNNTLVASKDRWIAKGY